MQQYMVYALGFGGGLVLGWLSEQYAIHLQKRMVIGWAESFTREAASAAE